MYYKGSSFVLRAFEKGDEASLAFSANNFEVWKTLRNVFPHPYTYDDAVQFVDLNLSTDKVLNFVIDIDGDAAGVIGIIPGDDIYCKVAEVGYWIGVEYWGKGIATEALQWMTDYCFKNFDINKIFASCFANNLASTKVLEKCGFKLEGIRKKHIFKNGEFIDEKLYALFKTL